MYKLWTRRANRWAERPSGVAVPRAGSVSGEVILELVEPGKPPIQYSYPEVEVGLRDVQQYKNRLTSSFLTGCANLVVGTGDSTYNKPNFITVGHGANSNNHYGSQNQDTNKILKTTGADQQFAQGFIGRDYRAFGLLWMKRIGTSTGQLWIEIQTDAAGLPSGTPIANGVSQVVSVNALAVTYGWVKFLFASPPNTTNGVQYHVVLKSSGYTYSAAVTEVHWGADASAPAHTAGQMTTYNGTTWSNVGTTDACFRMVKDHSVGVFSEIEGTLFSKILTGASVQGTTSATMRFVATFTTGEANDRINEVALLPVSSAVLYASATVDLQKTNQQALNVYWLISFTIV